MQEIVEFEAKWTKSPWDIIHGDDEFGRVALASSPKARVIWDAITAIRDAFFAVPHVPHKSAKPQSSAATFLLPPKKRPPLKPSSTSTCVRVGKTSMGMVVPPPAKKPRPSASSDGACVDAVAAVSVWDVNDEFTCPYCPGTGKMRWK